MNINSINNSYLGYSGAVNKSGNGVNSGNQFSNIIPQDKLSGESNLHKSYELRRNIRSLYETPNENNPFSFKTEDIVNSLYGEKEEESEDIPKNKYIYNYKEITSKIQRAKTSVSAGQAVLAAKRKVAQIRVKMANSKGDAKELQLALTHAKRIEMVAKKKKLHLENEELVERTLKKDEKDESLQSDVRDMMVTQTENKISEAADDIFEEREEIFDDALESLENEAGSINDEVLAGLNEMVAEFGEDMLEELEDSMEMLAGIEIIDPHMSEEDFENLKIKHRSSENKDIVKADTDYIHDMADYRQSSLVDITV